MFDSRSALGSRVHTPDGPRKSGMPDSVEMPAPVSTTTDRASVIQVATSSSDFIADQASVGSRRTTIDFDVGVLLPSAVESSGTRTFVSGKYAAAHPRAVG